MLNKLNIAVLLSAVATTLADNVAVESWQFEQVTARGYPWAVVIAAPMWNLPSGTCMPSAAENGAGHQTHGATAPMFPTVNNLADGCPPQPAWNGPRTPYKNVEGEPSDIPTYFKIAKCDHDQSWRVVYSVYFKSDATHKSDWEGAMVVWKSADGGNWWTRDSLHIDQHGDRKVLAWGDIPNTFNGNNDFDQDGVRDQSHPKLFFGKWKHATYETPRYSEKGVWLAGGDDFRNDDYYFMAYNNLRNAADPSVLDPNWKWGQASSPAAKHDNGEDKVDPCTW